MVSKRINILIVGAGRGGVTFLNLLHEFSGVNIVGVVDSNSKAPGIKIAEERGIPVSKNYKDFLKGERIDDIINVTGNNNVQKDLIDCFGDNCEIIGGNSAHLVWKLMEEKGKDNNILKEYEEKFQLLSEAASDGVIVHENGKIIDANKSFENMTGYNRTELSGKNILEFVYPEQIDQVAEKISSDYDKPYEVSGTRRDESIFPMEVCGKTFNFKSKTVQVLSIRDLSKTKKIEQDLKEQKYQQKIILDNIIDMVWLKDTKGKFITANKAFGLVSGADIESLCGKTDFDIWPEEIAKKYLAYEKEIMETEKHKRIEESVIDINGKERYVETIRMPIYDDEGEILGTAGVSRDVTARKKLNDALEKSEKKFRSFIERANEGVCLIKDEEIKYVNPKLQEMLGYSKYEMEGYSFQKFIHPDNLEFVKEKYKNQMKGQENPQKFELKVKTKDGRNLYILLNANLVEYEGEENAATLVFLQDITERKRIEEIIIESRDYLNNILNVIPDPVFVKDREHRWVLLNDSYCKFMGYLREELIGKTDYDYFPQAEADVFWEKDEKVFISSKENINEEDFTDSKGNKHVIVTKKALYVDSENNRFIVGIIRDITEKKIVETDLAKQKELIDKTNSELHEKVKELQMAMSRIKTLEGLVPICAGCKKMRLEDHDPKERDSWVHLEKYISERTNASFTHGLCPDCVIKLYGKSNKS